ncbi:hypothetical protein CRUP_002811 [Coryphaenoides rupestris]|nr:hypothetical protein CRUP_002811 [Coryphaenoides rupestris]
MELSYLRYAFTYDLKQPGFHLPQDTMEAIAKYDFNATADDELSFKRGEVLKCCPHPPPPTEQLVAGASEARGPPHHEAWSRSAQQLHTTRRGAAPHSSCP